jgi:hypothetical protein
VDTDDEDEGIGSGSNGGHYSNLVPDEGNVWASPKR